MPMTIAERRKKDRIRKAKQRARLKAARAPTPAMASAALAEAVSFCISGVNISDVRLGIAAISVEGIVRTAKAILVERMGCDRALSNAAVRKLLRPRPEHKWPSHIPSHSDPVQEAS